MNWCLLHRILYKIAGNWVTFIDKWFSLLSAAFKTNKRQESLWDRLHQSLAQLLVQVNLSQPLIGDKPLDSLYTPARNFVVSTGYFLSFCNLSLLRHLHVAVRRLLQRDDLLDTDKVKLCWRVLIRLTIFALQISGSYFNLYENSGSHTLFTLLQHLFIHITLRVGKVTTHCVKMHLRLFRLLRAHPNCALGSATLFNHVIPQAQIYRMYIISSRGLEASALTCKLTTSGMLFL